ncbi:MAG: radical SAM protein, partial [Desulfobacterales bacterium]|nr:radical SAM protein [Desulfobacterales bacterium]
MKVLVVSGNRLPMSPTGVAQIAGMARERGHDVRVFDCLVSPDPLPDLGALLKTFEPDLVTLSIPMVTCDTPEGDMGFPKGFENSHPLIRSVTDLIQRRSNAVILAGGVGFDYFPRDWLVYLNLEYGLMGECDDTFPLFLSRMNHPYALKEIPGIVVRSGDTVYANPPVRAANLNHIAMPAYDLFDVDYYNKMEIPWGITTKRGCINNCIHCYGMGERGYRLKTTQRVLDEIAHIRKTTGSDALIFCDTCLNRPIPHFRRILRGMTEMKAEVKWRAGNFKPLGFSRQFCQLLAASGCTYVGLSVETASARMLANLNRGYRVADIRQSLDHLSEVGIDFGVSLLLGAPGETLVSIKETLSVLDAYPRIKAVWVNVGVFGLRLG